MCHCQNTTSNNSFNEENTAELFNYVIDDLLSEYSNEGIKTLELVDSLYLNCFPHVENLKILSCDSLHVVCEYDGKTFHTSKNYNISHEVSYSGSSTSGINLAKPSDSSHKEEANVLFFLMPFVTQDQSHFIIMFWEGDYKFSSRQQRSYRAIRGYYFEKNGDRIELKEKFSQQIRCIDKYEIPNYDSTIIISPENIRKLPTRNINQHAKEQIKNQ